MMQGLVRQARRGAPDAVTRAGSSIFGREMYIGKSVCVVIPLRTMRSC